MKKTFLALLIITISFGTAPRAMAASISSGDLIKASTAAVYYYGADGKRYVFPNEKTYNTWYADFLGVKTISDAELAAIQIGGNATYKPSVKMVKITTDPKVYAVGKGGVLRWIKTEAAAIALYGADWNKKVEDVPDAFFTNYSVGAEIAIAADFDVNSEKAAATSIDADKNLSKPVAEVPAPPPPAEPAYVWTAKTVNDDAYNHQNLRLNIFGAGFVASWHDDRNGQNEAFYQVADPSMVKSGDAIKVSSNLTDSTNAKAAANNSNLYVVWEDSSPTHRALYTAKYDSGNNRLKSSLFTSSTFGSSRYPDIVWNGDAGYYGLAWWDTKSNPGSPQGNLHFSLMSAGGLKTGNETTVSDVPSLDFRTSVIAADAKFAVIWQGEDLKIKFGLIDYISGLVGAVKTVGATTGAISPRLAWSGLGFGAVWSDKNDGNTDIYFVSLDSSGNKIAEPKKITSGAGDAAEPDIIWSGDKFYVVYADYKPGTSGGSSSIKILKLNSDGIAAEEAASISAAGIKAHAPQLAKNSSLVGAAWLEDDGTANKIIGAVEIKK